MSAHAVVTGINVAGLKEAFSGSEEILVQMLGLFEDQARERLAQLAGSLAVWDAEAVRGVLHSLVTICGAVRAYGMSELAKAVGEAVKRGDRDQAFLSVEGLQREGALVLAQVSLMLKAAERDPKSLWSVSLSGGA